MKSYALNVVQKNIPDLIFDLLGEMDELFVYNRKDNTWLHKNAVAPRDLGHNFNITMIMTIVTTLLLNAIFLKNYSTISNETYRKII